ncbi:MAG TPA: DUF2520 domain-containing protein [Blastocatellia bacterium]|nr:DUF2520 domain-containing protein [Blastocatellia bacterium]
MRISIIGAGRVGQTLGRLAREAGYEIGEVVSRTRRSAQAAVKFIGSGEAQSAAQARLTAADLFLIATPDDRIQDAVEMILQQAPTRCRAVVLHTSGALASDALAPLASCGYSVGSCHPLQTFASPERALPLARGIYYCIEGDARAVRMARRLARDVGGRPFEIRTEMKSLYHVAAVMASGGFVSLLSISMEALTRCGLKEKEAQKVLLPLVEGTLANVRAVGPARALTGPVRRGDAGTVRRNLDALARINRVNSQWFEVYRALGLRAVTLAEKAGTDENALDEVRRLLES